MHIRSIEVVKLNKNGLRVSTDKMVPNMPIHLLPNQRDGLKSFAVAKMRLSYDTKWVMTVKCGKGKWYVFTNLTESDEN